MHDFVFGAWKAFSDEQALLWGIWQLGFNTVWADYNTLDFLLSPVRQDIVIESHVVSSLSASCLSF
jgi:hypothetical protein